MAQESSYDVAVLGAGFAGSALAAALARGGTRVLLLDPGGHPRFSTEEIVTPYTATLLRTMAVWHRVPELAWLADAPSASRRVSRSTGVGRTLGFLYHHHGRAPAAADVLQITSPAAIPAEPTLYRQDTDSFLFHAAVRYGADARQHVRLAEVRIETSGVSITAVDGRRFHAGFVVDAGGGGEAFAAGAGLVDGDRLPAHSWSLHTHLVGAGSMREATGSARAFGAPGRWDDGPCYHVFDGGYLWRVPFGNHRRSTSLVTGVGLTVDATRYPFPSGASPGDVWRDLIEPYPMIRAQLGAARVVQPWTVVTHRPPAGTTLAGPRWCALPGREPSGFFLSRGLTDQLAAVGLLAVLLRGRGAGGLDPAGVATAKATLASLRAGGNTLAEMVLAGTRNPLLWKAVLRVWEVGLLFGTLQAQGALRRLRRGDDRPARALAGSPDAGSPFPGDAGFRRLLDRAVGLCADGAADPSAAGERLFVLLRDAEVVPDAFGFTDPRKRYYHPTPPGLARLALWTLRSAPPGTGAVVRDGLRAVLGASARPSTGGAKP
ncbi:FAD-dependent monooxygenase [Micromonospora arborensis]|uniref:NAD(P)/FAD-dependent oxidoreductase n=1 Tax=Micromonospora arborensis TaxID=2116518 RepID=UPI00341D4A49